MTTEEHGVDSLRPGPEGWGKCVHWHRAEGFTDFPRTAEAYGEEHFSGIRWLTLDFGFAVEEVHYLAEGDHFCYTVGLARFGHPELLLYGFPYEVACVILSGLAWQVVLGKRRFAASDSPIALGRAEVRLLRHESEEGSEDYKWLPLANVLNGGPVDWLDVRVDASYPHGRGLATDFDMPAGPPRIVPAGASSGASAAPSSKPCSNPIPKNRGGGVA